MSNYLLSLHVYFAARKSSLKNVSENGQPHCAEWGKYGQQNYAGSVEKCKKLSHCENFREKSYNYSHPQRYMLRGMCN